MNKFLGFNNMNQVSYDFKAYPKCGFRADAWSETLLNDEYKNFIWYLNNKQGVPMVALNYTADLIHALYPQYARMAWDYLTQFSRDQKTGADQIQSIQSVYQVAKLTGCLYPEIVRRLFGEAYPKRAFSFLIGLP